MFFLSLFVCWPFKLFATIKPCSLINPTTLWLISFVRCARINIPSSSHFCATLTPHSNIKARFEFLFFMLCYCGIAKTFYCVLMICMSFFFFFFFFFLLGFTPWKAEQPLRAMDLQEQEAQKN